MRRRPPADSPRRGMAMVAVIACVILLMAVVAVLLRLGSLERRQSRAEERRQQAGWLAESGLERARVALEQNSAYLGEVWTISANEIGGDDSAVVRIEATPIPDHYDRRSVRAIADYPCEGTRRVRQTRSALIKLSSSSTGASR